VTARPAICVDGNARDVIEAPKLEPWIVRYELSDFEWAAIKPFLPNKCARNLVERFFNKIKRCRRVATRYDKLAANYLAFVQLASIRLWLRAL
jgi:transposase